ncbi:MAG: ATP-binding protein, partial [bacterium]
GIRISDSIQNIDKLLTKELELNIFRIIQESITNIIKHANATEASLSIMKDNKSLLITIWDNGIGISKERKDGLGLTGIDERIKLYRGELVIESVQPKGTLILISLPISKIKL